MKLFSNKSFEDRLDETIQFIHDDNDMVGGKLDTWYRNATPYDRKRVGEKLHIGKSITSGAKNDRKLRRAIMLMRAGVLRHEINKVVTEVTGISTSGLALKYRVVLNQCRHHAATPPTALDVIATQPNAKIEVSQAQRARARLLGIGNQRANLAHEIYIPVYDGNDNAIVSTKNYIKYDLCVDPNKSYKTAGQSLQDLDNGGELFIIGHGNLGAALGTHDKSYGAGDLAKLLQTDHLSRNPTQPVVIFLFCCWGATHTRHGIFDVKRKPYAHRLAKAMAKRGFNNVKIVGFAGSVWRSEQQQIVIRNNRRSNKNRLATPGNNPLPTIDYLSLGKDDVYSVYDIDSGDFNRTYGKDWTTRDGDIVTVCHRGAGKQLL